MIVLAIDDSELNLSLYKGILSKIGDVETTGFTSPARALEWAESNVADVILLDYHMPEIDGLTTLRRLRALPSAEQSLVVMVTADTERDVRHAALEAGASDFITKPIDRIEFTARVRNLLALSAGRRQLADRAQWLDEEVRRATAALVAREIETIVRLTRAAEFRDDVTGMHVMRVGHICAALGRTMGLTKRECDMLLLAAPMHDIGKVATPDGILLKAGPLTRDEYEVMKHHTVAGYEILKDSESEMLRCAAEIALTHHERYDGTGYPRGLQGSDIPLPGRLCSVADVFDALTSVRPYKDAWPIDRALEAIDDGSGTQFDAELVAVFRRSLPEILDIKARISDKSATMSRL